ncbi:MAG: efflux RND transporter periplasmic adaptor subunit [Alphaproteobacteria bacterium]|nr:MAG: efflux RND transporter periplasmic adaptor subunit [Alphaproteobacteria bacterium]
MKSWLMNPKVIAPLAIIGLVVVLGLIIILNAPEPQRRPPPSGPRINVETMTVTEAPFLIEVQSYGTVRPQTQSVLVAQVSGQVLWLNPQFRDGGFFKKGEVLLKLDDRDWDANVKIARATLLDAKRQYEEQKALADRARDEWFALGYTEEPNELVLRKPQLMAAEAKVASAEASLEKAELSLERTQIKAPFDGRLLKKYVDLGQVVSTNAQVAEIYATDNVEVRLPINNNDLGFIDLPEQLAGSGSEAVVGPRVELQSRLGAKQAWTGYVVRTESAIDETARQLHVVAQVNDPFGMTADGVLPLKMGEYVTAKIEGRSFPQAITIPMSTIYQGTYVYVAIEGVLKRSDIEIAWQNEDVALIESGLAPGDQLVLTPLGQVTSGTRVNVVNEQDSEAETSSQSPKTTSESGRVPS